MAFKFNEQLKQGHAGEELFMTLFPVELQRTEGRQEDFIVISNNKTIELKTDSYDPSKTANYFMERYSSREKKNPGGPWQSLSKGVDYYVYMFSKTNDYYVFKTQELVDHLDEKTNPKDLIGIPNKGYITEGYKVNRESIKHLLVDINKEFNNNKGE